MQFGNGLERLAEGDAQVRQALACAPCEVLNVGVVLDDPTEHLEEADAAGERVSARLKDEKSARPLLGDLLRCFGQLGLTLGGRRQILYNEVQDLVCSYIVQA